MKPVFLFFLGISTGVNAQQDTVIEYQDQDKIKSIEFSCQQGHFDPQTGELKSYDYWMSCDNGVIQAFDEQGKKIMEENNYTNCQWSQTFTDSCRTTTYYDYADGFLRHYITWRIINKSDTLEYTETFFHRDTNGVQTDSVFLNGTIFDRTNVVFYDSLENILYWDTYLADSSFESHYTLWYDANGRMIKEHYQTIGDIQYLPYENVCYFTFTGNIRIAEVFSEDSLIDRSYSEYNEKGLIVKETFMSVEESEAAKPEVRAYNYVYDSHGNWIEKRIYQNGILIVIERRKITYYSE